MLVCCRRERVGWRSLPEHRAAERRVAPYSAGHGDGRSVGHPDPVPRLQTRQTLPNLHAGVGGGECAFNFQNFKNDENRVMARN